MKFKFKKYLFLVNDLTAFLLKKEELKERKHIEKLRNIVIFLASFLLISIILNLYLCMK